MDQAVTTIARLRGADLRPTRQRVALADLMFRQGHRHLTAEQIHAEALDANIKVSLATVYNTLHQFTEVGLLREVIIAPGRSYFDTNVDEHHHFYVEGTGKLLDIPRAAVTLSCLPTPPDGMTVSRIEVIIRVEETPAGIES
jgi:Fur family transcriptional regulator, iron response regulator